METVSAILNGCTWVGLIYFIWRIQRKQKNKSGLTRQRKEVTTPK